MSDAAYAVHAGGDGDAAAASADPTEQRVAKTEPLEASAAEPSPSSSPPSAAAAASDAGDIEEVPAASDNAVDAALPEESTPNIPVRTPMGGGTGPAAQDEVAAPPAESDPTPARKTRFLVDVEREEAERVREALFPSRVRDAADDFLESTDVLALSSSEKEVLNRAITRSAKEKSRDFRDFASNLARPENQVVARMFFLTSAAMFTLPLAALGVGMHVIGPYMGWDAVLAGGAMAVATTVVIGVLYVMYALREEGVIGSGRMATDQAAATGQWRRRKTQ